MRKAFALASVFVLSVAVLGAGADEKKEAAEAKKAKAKPTCPVSGGPCKKEHAVAYKGAEVYFCCPNCPKAFSKDTAKFSTKANLQLVMTKQAKQKKCPISGQPINKEKTAKVAGVKVGFCCGNCLAKAEGAEGDKQLALVFADKAFEKGFSVTKKEEKKAE